VNWYAHSSKLFEAFYPSLCWRIISTDNSVYLTFDDGPNPVVTPFVLDVLKRYNMKATFFCIGENVAKYPDVYQNIIDHGHTIGNHTFNHLNGYNTSPDAYLKNVDKASTLIDSKLFRPPYGRIRKSQISLISMTYDIVMWSVLSGDFDQNLDLNRAFVKMIKNTKSGSIIVFHDSIKAYENLKTLLPKYCTHLAEKGFVSCGM
jgi:peptidoglycan-N-acetylglucosamine deacetylase